MKSLLRVLSYSHRFPIRLFLFLTYSTIGILFGVVNYVMAIPLFSVLFNTSGGIDAVSPMPSFSFSTDYARGVFLHYLSESAAGQGKDGMMKALFFICIVLLSCVFLANLFRYLERIIATKIRVDLVKNLKMAMFKNLTRFEISFFNNERRGDVMSRFTNDAHVVESAVVDSLKSVLKEPITIAVSFIVLVTLSAKLTLFTIIVLPLTGGMVGEIIRRLRRTVRAGQESLGRVSNILDETFGGMRVIKAFNARSFVISKMEAESENFRQLSKSVNYKYELSSPLSEMLGVCIIVGITLYGGHLVFDKEMTPEVFLGFLAIFASIIQPVKNFSNGIASLQRGLVSAQRIFYIFDKHPKIFSKENAAVVNSFTDIIEFKDVSFAYEQNNVLHGVSFVIPKGKTVALVGHSGGGKSTLADLLPRFYDVGSGSISIDGKDIRDIELDSLHSLMGIVTQDSILFHDTIFNNIAFGMPDATEEKVIHAAKIANAHDFIMETEQGYQTVIGERGAKLSGGQRQRISIARAVLRDPPILILDEATSALDTASEKAVQEALANLMKDKTSLVIAHRLSTVQNADMIIVIQQGKIVEQGTNDELLAQGGIYQTLRTTHA